MICMNNIVIVFFPADTIFNLVYNIQSQQQRKLDS